MVPVLLLLMVLHHSNSNPNLRQIIKSGKRKWVGLTLLILELRWMQENSYEFKTSMSYI